MAATAKRAASGSSFLNSCIRIRFLSKDFEAFPRTDGWGGAALSAISLLCYPAWRPRVPMGSGQRRRCCRIHNRFQLDPLELLSRKDKWFLGGGKGAIYAPPF